MLRHSFGVRQFAVRHEHGKQDWAYTMPVRVPQKMWSWSFHLVRAGNGARLWKACLGSATLVSAGNAGQASSAELPRILLLEAPLCGGLVFDVCCRHQNLDQRPEHHLLVALLAAAEGMFSTGYPQLSVFATHI